MENLLGWNEQKILSVSQSIEEQRINFFARTGNDEILRGLTEVQILITDLKQDKINYPDDIPELCHIINQKERELKRLIRVMNLREYINEQDTLLYQALIKSITEQVKNIMDKLNNKAL